MKLNYDFYSNDLIHFDREKFQEENIKTNIELTNLEETYKKLYYSPQNKENILYWYPFKENSKFLQIGIDNGELTDALCKLCDKLTRVEFSKAKAECLYKKYNYIENFEIVVGALEQIKFENNFDYIFLVGDLLRLTQLSSNYKKVSDFIKKLKDFLVANGKIIFIFDNKFSAYNIATNTLFANKYQIGKNEFINILEQSELENFKFYYAFPNYRHTNVIFSDDYLPSYDNTKINYVRFYNKDTICTQNEIDIVKKAIINSSFDILANSYFVEVSLEQTTIQNTKPVFVTYNILRKEKFQLITKIYNNNVIKTFISNSSKEHLKEMIDNLKLLKEIGFNTIENNVADKQIESKFIKEKTYDKVLVDLFKNGQIDEFLHGIDKWINYIKNKFDYLVEVDQNVFTDFNIKVEEDIFKTMNFVKNGLIDIVFENTFEISDEFYIFDQEWKFNNVPIEFIIYRAIKNFFVYYSEIGNDLKIQLFEKYEISQYIELFNELERKIQNYINDDTISELYLDSIKKLTDIDEIKNFKQEIIDKDNLILEKEKEINRIVEDNAFLNKTNKVLNVKVDEMGKEIKRIVDDNLYLNNINKELNKIINGGNDEKN